MRDDGLIKEVGPDMAKMIKVGKAATEMAMLLGSFPSRQALFSITSESRFCTRGAFRYLAEEEPKRRVVWINHKRHRTGLVTKSPGTSGRCRLRVCGDAIDPNNFKEGKVWVIPDLWEPKNIHDFMELLEWRPWLLNKQIELL